MGGLVVWLVGLSVSFTWLFGRFVLIGWSGWLLSCLVVLLVGLCIKSTQRNMWVIMWVVFPGSCFWVVVYF